MGNAVEVVKGWVREVRDALEGDFKRVHFIQKNEEGLPTFSVIADHRGVQFSGTSPFLVNPQDYESLAKIMGFAGQDSLKLRRGKIQVVGDNEIKKLS